MWRSISICIVSMATHGGVVAQPVLVPGARLADCRSVLQVGIVTCREREADSNEAQSANEARVTEYLAEYGKPPREAVRALLDPSDDNIAAWIRKQRQVISMATYVASRMTELQSHFKPGSLDPPASFSQLPAMVQMRATLFIDAQTASSQHAANALHQVASRYPSLDARIVLVEFQPETRPSNWLAKLNTLLPVSIASPGTVDSLPLPSLLIEDLRYQARQRLSAVNITAQEICDQIVALRTAFQTDSRAR